MKLTSKIQSAINYSAIFHCKQKRKVEKLPYIVHPFSVAFLLLNYTNDENVIIAALLHDSLEDSRVADEKELEKEFGSKIMKIVHELTEDKSPYDSKKKSIATWQARKAKSLEMLENASHEALIISCADKVHNLRTMASSIEKMGQKIFKQFNASPEKIINHHGEVLKIIEKRLSGDIVKEYRSAYFTLKRLIKI